MQHLTLSKTSVMLADVLVAVVGSYGCSQFASRGDLLANDARSCFMHRIFADGCVSRYHSHRVFLRVTKRKLEEKFMC